MNKTGCIHFGKGHLDRPGMQKRVESGTMSWQQWVQMVRPGFRYLHCSIICVIFCLSMSSEGNAQSRFFPTLPENDTVIPKRYPPLYDFVFEYDYPQRWKLIDTVFNNAYPLLNNKEHIEFRIKILKEAAVKHKDPKAQLLADMLTFTFAGKLKIATENNINQMYTTLMDEADRLAFDEAECGIMSQYAFYLKDSFQKDALALYYLIKSLNRLQQLPPNCIPHQGDFISTTARAFYDYAMYEKAARIGTIALKYEISRSFKLYNHNLIGMAYLKLAKPDSAIDFFNLAIADLMHFQKKPYQTWIGILKGNIARAYALKGQEEKAISLYQYAIDQTFKYKVWDNTSSFVINLADILLRKRKYADVSGWLPLAIKTTRAAGSISDHFKLHSLLARYYRETGNDKLALLHSDSAHDWEDSLNMRTGNNIQIQAELELEIEKRKAGDNELSAALKEQQIFRVIALLVMLTLAVFATLLIMRSRLALRIREKDMALRQQRMDQELALEKARLHEEQTIARLKLQEFTNIIIEKNRQIEFLEKSASGEDQDGIIQKLQLTTILTEEQWGDFKRLFDKVHPGYLVRLKEKMPGLSQAETRYIVLSKLKMTNKEMASVQGISPHAVRTVGYRLKDKLKLSNGITLETLIDDI